MADTLAFIYLAQWSWAHCRHSDKRCLILRFWQLCVPLSWHLEIFEWCRLMWKGLGGRFKDFKSVAALACSNTD